MHHLLRHKIIVIVLLGVFGTLTAFGQKSTNSNRNFWDFRKKPYYFGITLGGNSSGYLVNKSRDFISNDSIRIVSGVNNPGLNLHIITNLKIGEFFDFRFIPGFSFSERKLEYTPASGPKYQKTIESVFLELPLHLRFKSVPYKDKRIFVVGGVKYTYDVQSNSRARNNLTEDLIRIAPHDFQFEIGTGIQFFLPFFIFSPEIKFSQGIGNIHIYNGSLNESRVIDKVLSRAFSISFHFEG